MRKLLTVAACGCLALAAVACGSNSSSDGGGGSPKSRGSINGAGATFPQPVYDEWGARTKDKLGLTVNYQGIGSGGGVAQFTAGTVAFGASDAAMTDDELKAAEKKGEPVHVPSVFGAVTVSYNAPGVKKGLKLDGATIADMFLGKVKKWNDPAIAKQNAGASLPSQDITVCHRSDESGTTKLFTSFLADYSPAWKSGPGVDKTVKWPTGTGAKGNDGVAACVKQNQGAVGYVEQAYALQNNFATADVKNKTGSYIAPTLQSTSAAGEGLKIPSDLRFSAIDAPGAKAYPIASSTFLLVYKDQCKAGASKKQAGNVKAWLDYALGDGQKVAPQLQYAPLPAKLHTEAQAKVKSHTSIGLTHSDDVVDAGALATRGDRSALERSPLARLPDQALKWALTGLAGGVLLLIGFFFVRLYLEAKPAFDRFGVLGFTFDNNWDVSKSVYGALPLLVGTLITSAIALVMAVPVAVATALYIVELCPRRLRQPLTITVELLAAVPSVVYGLWGVFVLIPKLQPAEKWVSDTFGFLPFVGGTVAGPNYFIGGLILAIMILPIVSAISREVVATVPVEHKEAALALGATRWEMIRMAVLPHSRAGISGAVMLGLGRAIGETIAVTLVIGNAPQIGDHLFAQGYTLAAVVANEFGEAASDPAHRAALIAAGLVLFVLTLAVNAVARRLVRRAGQARA